MQNFEIEFAGKKLKLTFNQLANQSNGNCLAQYGETVVLGTVCLGDEKDTDFLPLTVEYEERFYAAGMIKSSRFIKRELRPPEEAILSARMIDRSLRPLFPKDLKYEVQIILTVLAVDEVNDPDLVGLYAAIGALLASDIPFYGPVAGLRLGRINQEWVLNPSYKARAKSEFDLVISGLPGRITMIEAQSKEVDKEILKQAFEFGNKHLGKLCSFFKAVEEKIGKKKKWEILEPETKEEKEIKKEQEKIVESFIKKNILEFFFQKPLLTKDQRLKSLKDLKEKLEEELISHQIGKEKREKLLKKADKLISLEIGRIILEKEKRIDGRKLDQLRDISINLSYLPRVHGSAIFQRGETQVLSVVTLGSPALEQYVETIEEKGKKRFIHHYNFLPFSSGETGPLRVSRRSIGHGHLVEKSFLSILPSKEEFPYTIRVVSEVLSSNGSTSMASACATSLALMDAGVPIKRHLAGIAIGLASEENREKKIEKYKIFADLQDLEDGPKGMDFKVTATRKGICAIQMDTKTFGLSLEIIFDALDLADKKIQEILDLMEEKIKQPRKELSPYAPRIFAFHIDAEKIRDVIGPGGRVINEIISKTGVTIDIEPDGFIVVTSDSDQALKKAVDWIKDITREIKVGEIFQGKVKKIVDFGVFVEIVPGQEGLVHISELSPRRIRHPKEVVEIGEIVPVKVISIDQMGRINLSIKQALKRKN